MFFEVVSIEVFKYLPVKCYFNDFNTHAIRKGPPRYVGYKIVVVSMGNANHFIDYVVIGKDIVPVDPDGKVKIIVLSAFQKSARYII